MISAMVATAMSVVIRMELSNRNNTIPHGKTIKTHLKHTLINDTAREYIG